MRYLITTLLLLAVATPTLAFDLQAQAPTKPQHQSTPPAADPAMLRQGGDTIADAVAIAMPYTGSGTTAGYTNDYDEVCPYSGSTSPDVVYLLTPDTDMLVNVDLLGSAYDTKAYIYDAELNLIACNDDFHPDYTSFLEAVPLVGGAQYYLVIDGYGGDAGEYQLAIDSFVDCALDCPAGAQLEGEPPLTNDYEDNWNSGCGGPGLYWQSISEPEFCGVGGWYLSSGSTARDTDWFLITIPADGVLEITGDSERPLYMFELGPQDCGSVGVIQNVQVGPCAPGTMTIYGEAGSPVWFWTGATTFESPDGSYPYEFDYVLQLNLPVAVEDHSWSQVKGLFR